MSIENNPEHPLYCGDGLMSQSIGPVFQGKPLWPLTLESDLILCHVERGTELAVFQAMAFVFVHIQRGGETFFRDLEKIMPLVWNDPNRFRVAVLEHFSKLPAEARKEAYDICAEAYGWVRKSAVNGIPPNPAKGARPSKKKATTRRSASGKRSGSGRR